MNARWATLDGRIDIVVRPRILRFATEQHPAFWDGESGASVPNIKIIDFRRFSKEVVAALNREDEDGSTPLTRMLDAAIQHAIEQGCEGVDHDYAPAKSEGNA